jgi:hypothetical protein
MRTPEGEATVGRQRWGGNGGEANMGRPRVTRAIFTFGSAALAAGPPFADPPAIAVCRGPAATNSDTSKPIDPWTAPGRIDDGVTGLGILSGNAVGAVVLGQFGYPSGAGSSSKSRTSRQKAARARGSRQAMLSLAVASIPHGERATESRRIDAAWCSFPGMLA